MSKYSGIAHYQDFNELVKLLGQSNSTYDIDKITKAYKFAEKAHGDQRRVSGIPYILHPTSVACILAELGMDTDAICAALLHDVVEDTPTTLEEVEKLFGADVAKLIDGVTKISKIAFSSREQRQAENIRKMLIAMANDIRVIIIKLADRLHNMRTISCMPEQSRRDKAHENMQVYAPIAHRLGIKTIKDELEDLSLQYLDPIGYKEIEDAISLSENDRDKFIESIKNIIEGEEAVLKVVRDTDCLVCFSCPCSCNVGDVLTEPLECLNTDNIILCETKDNIIEKIEGEFKYKLSGKLIDMQNGIVEVKGFNLHIDEDKIPKDMSNGMCIQFEVSRIDIW